MERTRGMLSPDPSVVDLPPSAVEPPLPVAPPMPPVYNSPSQGRYPSSSLVSESAPAPSSSVLKVNALPPGFVPSAPSTPLPQDTQLQSTPRSTPINLYAPVTSVPQIQRSSSSSSTTSNYPKAMHSRSRSMGQPPSLDSVRSKTPHARPPSSLGSGPPIYQGAPQPPGGYPVGPGPAGNAPESPRSTTSRMSGHTRSRSLYAGSTPAPPSRPLSAAPPSALDSAHQLRRASSVASDDSGVSGQSRSSRKSHTHYDPNRNLDPAWLAGSQELPLSPNTRANTRANAARTNTPGPGSRNSSALSYASLRGDGIYQ
ncbi:uncharacterized protein PHACADRAFT_250462 [Phanerochaete carnosa HHB-10118-sp]|uniref:Uncharacterized protein n=1 Tax=Phanerochaete carnosa (strain HHB-10118-sp) TaxID=650164 RepID=K5VA55_PHACS|nr:uncharacterized protein PHACADRAFT_250462 [Phanerochaete carnosa HHB-10118-sp]EKM59756.1 hypothetical protein PHACADRAFT_250462 [Phanerochaete carnosa HHB-10118-sp]